MPWDDHGLAAEAATRAARVLMALRQTGSPGGAALGEAGDRQANEAIVQLLRAERPEDGLLSEESAPDASRLQRRRVWIVDPLDGTREYADAGARTDWAVHVALCLDGAPIAAVVALPALQQSWSMGQAVPLSPAPSGRLRILVSRTRAPALARRVAERLDAELMSMGSAGAKAAAVLRGDAHAYLHAGGLNEWDSCAPVGVALAAGLHASRLDGSACRYNQGNPSMPDVLICRREWATALLDAVSSA